MKSYLREDLQVYLVENKIDLLNNSLKAIESVKKGLKEGLSGDLISIDLNDAIINISIITGKIDIDQDILGSIFSKFCIGK